MPFPRAPYDFLVGFGVVGFALAFWWLALGLFLWVVGFFGFLVSFGLFD
ncbi:MAG: hypothetical protein K8963_03940 [Proteobacteria bacterium]|nr:hypothetical protein [Pseudomonadota bacterium]